MATSVFVGRWTDYSLEGIYSDVVTLSVRDGAFLIAALSTFVTLVGTSFWSLIAFCIHQCRASEYAQDGFYFQQQALYRNAGTPAAALLDVSKMCWAWRKPRSGPRRAASLKTRSLKLALPALLIFVAFTIAGVFVGNVAGKAYSSNNVLIREGRCGQFQYNFNTIPGLAAATQKYVNDTLAGRAYATNCYGNNTAVLSADCGQYPLRALPRSSTNVSCPFGQDPLSDNLCLPAQNTAYQLSTPALGSNSVFGINAPIQNRITVSKHLTCAPLHVHNYETSTNSTAPIYYLNLGPVYDHTTGLDQNYTLRYDSRIAKAVGVGYQINSVFAASGSWLPVAALQVPTGDVSVHFMMPNSIAYVAPVDDIFFAAHDQIDPNNAYVGYTSDLYVYAMGCIDQYQICNPTTSPPSCTILGNLNQTSIAINQIGLNAPQLVTARRLTLALVNTNTFLTVSPVGASALLAHNKIFGTFYSTGLPTDQWKSEVEGWFDTSLAKLQAYVNGYVSNTADLGPYGRVVSSSSALADNALEIQAADHMCSQQRIRNTGGYQTFSFLGLMIIVCVGSLIILLSWTVEPIVGKYRSLRKSTHRDYKEIARVADRTFQLQRMALNQGQEGGRWEKTMGSVPVTKSETTFMPPRRMKLNHGDDYVYEQRGWPLIEVQQHVPKPQDRDYGSD